MRAMDQNQQIMIRILRSVINGRTQIYYHENFSKPNDIRVLIMIGKLSEVFRSYPFCDLGYLG
jgi:hypothetical protein